MRLNQEAISELNRLFGLFAEESSKLNHKVVKEVILPKCGLYIKMLVNQIASDIFDIDIPTNDHISKLVDSLQWLSGLF
jgi:hypothetical protein